MYFGVFCFYHVTSVGALVHLRSLMYTYLTSWAVTTYMAPDTWRFLSQFFNVYNFGSLEKFLKKTGSNFLISEIWSIFPKHYGYDSMKVLSSYITPLFIWYQPMFVGFWFLEEPLGLGLELIFL
jgi:hypothetical protein